MGYLSLGAGSKGRLRRSGLEFVIVESKSDRSVIRFRFDFDAKHPSVLIEVADMDLRATADGISEWGEKEKQGGSSNG